LSQDYDKKSAKIHLLLISNSIVRESTQAEAEYPPTSQALIFLIRQGFKTKLATASKNKTVDVPISWITIALVSEALDGLKKLINPKR